MISNKYNYNPVFLQNHLTNTRGWGAIPYKYKKRIELDFLLSLSESVLPIKLIDPEQVKL